MGFIAFKKTFIALGVTLSLLYWGGCKAKHGDSEPLLNITFYPKNHIKKFHCCFNSIRGKGGSLNEQLQCVDSATTISIPYNINSDTSIFIFQHDSVNFDTLALTYKNQIDQDADSYYIELSQVTIIQCTFDSLIVNCNGSVTNDSTKQCPYDIKSITVYM